MEQVKGLSLSATEVCTFCSGGCSLKVAGANSWCQVRVSCDFSDSLVWLYETQGAG